MRIAVVSGTGQSWQLPTFLEPVRSAILPGRPPSGYQHSVAGDWIEAGRGLLELTTLDAADVAVLSFGLEAVPEAPELLSVARDAVAAAGAAGKFTLVFCSGDVHVPSPGAGAIVFRTSVHRRTAAPTDVVLPAFVEDPQGARPLRTRDWAPKPVVAFTGHAYPLGQPWDGVGLRAVKFAKAAVRAGLTVTGLARRLGVPELHPSRPLAVAALARSRAVDGRVRLRQQVVRLDMQRDEDARRHEEFLDDIEGADYVLAPRGFGNYSYRLYESLAMGRVPILVDTGAPLPCAEVPWSEISVTIRATQLHRLASITAGYHDRHRLDWPEVQLRCRRAWETHLSASAFFRRVVGRLAASGSLAAGSPADIARSLR